MTTTKKKQIPKQQEGEISEIEELHRKALLRNSTTYTDPVTGFVVFTELAHLRRGKCCGSQCRHCPYGWGNVVSGVRKDAKIESGDLLGARVLLDKIALDASQYSGCDNSTSSLPNGESFISTNAADVSNDSNSATDPRTKGKGGRRGGKYTTKNVPYTRTGDSGTSALFTGERRAKDDAVFEAMGTIDELCSFVGTVHAELLASLEPSYEEATTNKKKKYGELPEWLILIMSRLFDIGSLVAKPCKKKISATSSDKSDHDDDDDTRLSQDEDGVGGDGFDSHHIDTYEDWIDIITEQLPELTSFILPTGSRVSAQLHVTRTVCRRAERTVVGLVVDEEDGVCDPNVGRYLNRLSDFFFVAARYVNYCEGRQEEIQYKRHHRGAKQRDAVIVPFQNEKKNK